MRQRWVLVIPVLTLALVGMGSDWDSSVRIKDGETHTARISSLNGPIRIGDGARTGDCKSVNGSIEIGMNSQVGDISAVNGQVEIDAGTMVDGGISTVNGSIELARGVSASDIASVNGRISLRGAEIEGDVSTMNGDVRLSDGAVVGGNVIIEDRGRNSSDRRRPLRIEITDGAVVRGDVINEDEDAEVELILRNGGIVEGSIENIKVIDR